MAKGTGGKHRAEDDGRSDADRKQQAAQRGKTAERGVSGRKMGAATAKAQQALRKIEKKK